MSNKEQIKQPLSGIKIIELASIGPVPFASSMMQQMGAQVTIVAPPENRGLGLPLQPEFDYLGHDKDTIKIDLRNDEGIQELLSLVKECDVLLEGFRPNTLERMGLDPSILHKANPALIIGRCGGWGNRSTRAMDAGHDINYLALSGALNAIGDTKPIPPLNLVGDFGGAAMHLLSGVLAALVQLKNDGSGCVVSTSIYEGSISLTNMIYGLLDGGLWQDNRMSNILDGAAPYYKCYQTKDNKWLALGAIETKFFKIFLDLAQIETVDIKRQNDRSYWPELENIIASKLAMKTRDEWDAIFKNTDACCTPVLTLSEARSNNDTSIFFKNNKPFNTINFN